MVARIFSPSIFDIPCSIPALSEPVLPALPALSLSKGACRRELVEWAEGAAEESIKTKAGFAGLNWLYTKYEVYPEQSRRDYRLIMRPVLNKFMLSEIEVVEGSEN